MLINDRLKNLSCHSQKRHQWTKAQKLYIQRWIKMWNSPAYINNPFFPAEPSFSPPIPTPIKNTHPNKDSNAGFRRQVSSTLLLSTAVGGSLQKKNFKEILKTEMGSSNKVGKFRHDKLIRTDYWTNTTSNFHDCLCLHYKDGSFSLQCNYLY